MVRELALAVGPGGRVHALDLSGPMLALARRRCGDLPGVGLAAGDMTALALPDGSVDAAVALQSLAYVPDVARAIGEIARVLRPGGRAVVFDTGLRQRDLARPRPGPRRPHPGGVRCPRRASGAAAPAGPAGVGRGPRDRPARGGADPERVVHADTFAHGIAPFIRDFVVGAGRVPAGEADAWLAECAALDAAGEFFASLNRYLFVLRRPG